MTAERIYSNYIYNMAYDEEHETSKFDVLLEIRRDASSSPFRVMIALEYLPAENELRVIPLY